jgi:hypothetical protein
VKSLLQEENAEVAEEKLQQPLDRSQQEQILAIRSSPDRSEHAEEPNRSHPLDLATNDSSRSIKERRARFNNWSPSDSASPEVFGLMCKGDWIPEVLGSEVNLDYWIQ